MSDVGIRGERPSSNEPPPLIELVVLEPRPKIATTVAASDPQPGRSSSPRRGRRVALVALIGVSAVIAIAVAVGDAGENKTRPPASTGARATDARATIAPLTTTGVPPSITIGPTSTPATSASPNLTVPQGFPGGPKGYTWVSFNRSEMATLDLENGQLSKYPSSARTVGDADSPVVFRDRVLYTSYVVTGNARRPTVWSQAYADAPPVKVVDRATIVTESATPNRLWIRLVDETTDDGYPVAEIDLDGRRVTTLTVPAGLRVVGASTDGLWLFGSGVVFAITRAGAVRPIATGSVRASAFAGVLYDDCATAGPCSLRYVNWQSMTSLVGPSAELQLADTSIDPVLSPDGRWLLLADRLLDRRSNTPHAHPYELLGWRWSADGEWLFLSTRGDAVAWNLRDQRRVGLGFHEQLAGVIAQ